MFCLTADEEDISLLPGPSHPRIDRDVSFERYWSGSPYRTSISCLPIPDVRSRESHAASGRRPASSRMAKVKGVVGSNAQQLQREGVLPDDPKKSLIVIGKEECEDELLLTKAPGFAGGISQVQSKSDVETELAILEARKKKRLAQLEEESLPAQSKPEEPAFVNAYPDVAGLEKQEIEQEKEKAYTGPWSIMDESSVQDFYEKVPQLAVQYSFELDVFQKRAVVHLERGESVFVAAHTSAGKTVVAEYAVALAFEHRTKLVYTSPIKTLSNQKFRDFSEKFGADKVGLLTGDNSVNPNAPCLIMTTEILRSMLYRGAEMIRDVEFVVFDEVHYISDPERGVIWEEVVIMLPMHVHCVMLSATTPNTMEFSAWVGRNRREPVYVVSTEKRPVPLEHYLYAAGEMFKILDSQTGFNVDGHMAAGKALRAKDPFAEVPGRNQAKSLASTTNQRFAQQKWSHGSGFNSKNQKTGDNTWLNLIKDLDKKKMLPVIVFTFSKRLVESRALALSKLDLLNAKEKSAVHVTMQRALSRLQEGDRELPQIRRVKQYLSRGIGIHHGGLLPILKEVVEICFTSGFVRVLVATETFAMGVNAPCRTVIFGGLRKHDGNEFRDLLPGEYIQMCGRAGRRGLDTVGTVLILCEEDVPPIDNLSRIMSGQSSKLASRFRLRYSMILNLLRTDNLSVADMMKRSFSEFARQTTSNSKSKQLKSLKADAANAAKLVRDFSCVRTSDGAVVTDIEDYDKVMTLAGNETASCVADFMQGIHGRKAREDVLRPGRVVLVVLREYDLYSVPAVIVQETNTAFVGKNVKDDERFIAVVLLPRGFTPPNGAERLVAFLGEETAFTKKQIGGGGIQKRKGMDDDDDDEFSALKKKKKNVASAAQPVFFQRGAAAAVSSVPTAKSETLPKFLFGKFQNDDDNNGSHELALMRLSIEEIEHISSLALDAGVHKDLAASITLQRSERDCGVLAKALLRKIASEQNRIELREIDVMRDLKADEMSLVRRWKSAQSRRSEMALASLCQDCDVRNEHRVLANRAARLQEELNSLRNELSDESLKLFPDFVARLEVLKRLKYVSSERNDHAMIELKGRVGCEINTCNELLLAEMVFENVFDPLDPAECAALLSALVLQQKCEDQVIPLTDALSRALEETLRIASGLQHVQEDLGVSLDSDDWVKTVLNPGLLGVVYEWSKGRPFASLTSFTSLEEGVIVRAITRLDETCREVKNIARLIGDPALLQKMESASLAIKRDIVFATSLYVG